MEGGYRQGMAPASASPQPPSGRPDTGDRGKPESDATYGPLSLERQIKQDGRALILYARRESSDQ
jgi:hypothetical protein